MLFFYVFWGHSELFKVIKLTKCADSLRQTSVSIHRCTAEHLHTFPDHTKLFIYFGFHVLPVLDLSNLSSSHFHGFMPKCVSGPSCTRPSGTFSPACSSLIAQQLQTVSGFWEGFVCCFVGFNQTVSKPEQPDRKVWNIYTYTDEHKIYFSPDPLGALSQLFPEALVRFVAADKQNLVCPHF